MKTLFWFMAWLMLPHLLAAQAPAGADSLAPGIYEDAAQATTAEEEADWSFLERPLAGLLRQPLDLNRARPEQLLALPGMTAPRVQALRLYMQATGPLVVLEELARVPGFSPALVAQLRPLVRVGAAYDVAPWLQVRLRLTTLLEEPVGYSPAPDSGTSRYAGGRLATYARVEGSLARHWQAGVLVDNDAGEAWALSTRRQQWGPDFVGGYVLHRPPQGVLGQLLLGDYVLHYGQGLLYGPPLLPFRTAAGATLQLPTGARPYLAATESGFLRGAMAQLRAPQWQLDVWASHQPQDATLNPDADDDQAGAGTARLRRSGLHRTTTERDGRAALDESQAGLTALWYPTGGVLRRLGLTASQQLTSLPLVPGEEPYQRLDPQGSSFSYFSLHGAVALPNGWLEAEAAQSYDHQAGRGAQAATAGLLVALGPDLDASLSARVLTEGFHGPRSQAYARSPSQPRNEYGGLLGLTWQPAQRWQVTGWADAWQHPWWRYRASAPTTGTEALLEGQWQATPLWRLAVRARTLRYALDPPAELLTTPVRSPTPARRSSLRLEATRPWGFSYHLRLRAEYAHFTHTGVEQRQGWLLGAEGQAPLARRLEGTLWLVWAQVPDYDARIYAREPDVPGLTSQPSLQHTGLRAALRLQWRPTPAWHLHLRLAHTLSTDGRPLGSGLEALPGPTRTQLRVQVVHLW